MNGNSNLKLIDIAKFYMVFFFTQFFFFINRKSNYTAPKCTSNQIEFGFFTRVILGTRVLLAGVFSISMEGQNPKYV